eukprot:scaffold3902_cov140-Isochrysis_galbana.AAC.2
MVYGAVFRPLPESPRRERTPNLPTSRLTLVCPPRSICCNSVPPLDLPFIGGLAGPTKFTPVRHQIVARIDCAAKAGGPGLIGEVHPEGDRSVQPDCLPDEVRAARAVVLPECVGVTYAVLSEDFADTPEGPRSGRPPDLKQGAMLSPVFREERAALIRPPARYAHTYGECVVQQFGELGRICRVIAGIAKHLQD